LSDRDARILGGVVEIDMQVALDLQREVDQRMPRELFQHVVEKAHSRGYGIVAAPVEIDPDLDARLIGSAFERSLAHGTMSPFPKPRLLASPKPGGHRIDGDSPPHMRGAERGRPRPPSRANGAADDGRAPGLSCANRPR